MLRKYIIMKAEEKEQRKRKENNNNNNREGIYRVLATVVRESREERQKIP